MLTVAEKLDIVHDAIVKQLLWKDIAKEHRVSISVIAQLISKAKKKPEFIREIHLKQDKAAAKEAAISKVVDKLVTDDAFIDNCQQVSLLVNAQSGLTVTDAETRKVMHSKGMRYRKVQHVPLQANSARNLILRQRWAMTVLEKDYKHKVYLNIDETWLGMRDYRRLKW